MTEILECKASGIAGKKTLIHVGTDPAESDW